MFLSPKRERSNRHRCGIPPGLPLSGDSVFYFTASDGICQSELSSEVQHLDQQFSNSLFHKSAAETKCSTLRGLALINARPRSSVFGETRERFRPLG